MSTAILLVVKVSVLFAAAWMGLAIAGRARASLRHVILTAAFAAVLVLPIATSVLPGRPVRVLRAPLTSAATIVRPDDTEPRPSAVAESRAVRPVAPPRWPRLPLVTLLEWAWLAGTCIAMLPLLGGLRELRRIRREAVECELTGEGGVPRTLVHEHVPGPMTFGVLRPVIVLPVDAYGWAAADLQRALRHEREHVRRRDCLVDAIARLTCAIYWFHPLAWRSWHRLRPEAERACDDAVLLEGDAIGYAEQLVSLATRLTTPAPLMAMAGGRDLSQRVRALLDGRQPRGRAGRAWTTGVTVVALVTVGLIAPLSAGLQVSANMTPLSFDVASVKENTSGDPFGGGDSQMLRLYPGGHFVARNASLKELILSAYRDEISPSQLSGLADWMSSRRFDIDARAAEGAIAPGELDYPRAVLMDRMLQGLLLDRFKLRVRRDQQVGDLYVLSVAAGGPRLQRAKSADECVKASNPGGLTVRAEPVSPCHVFTRIGRTGLEGVAVDTADLAMALRLYLRSPVEDRAKLTMLSDVSVHWNPDPLGGAPRGETSLEPQPVEGDPDIYTAFREQLGLKLDRQRGPIETLIVESAEPPAAN